MIKTRYSALFLFGMLLFGAWTMSGCSDSSSPQGTKSNLSFSTQLSQSTIRSSGTTGKFEPESHGARVDSIRIDYVGMLVSGLKMHMIGGIDDDDDTNATTSKHDISSHDHGNGKSQDGKKDKDKDDHDHDHGHGYDHSHGHDHGHGHDHDDIIIINLDHKHDGTIITGPYLLEFDTAGTHLVTRASIPAGVYDRIKFEIHKIRGAANDPFLNDSALVQFLSNDATIIIRGHVWDNGVMYPFTYYSRVTANLQVHFDPAIVIENDVPANVSLTFEPGMVFSSPFSFGRPIDPRDPDNRKHIEEAIKLAFKMAKALN
jgi:hypothetical protein